MYPAVHDVQEVVPKMLLPNYVQSHGTVYDRVHHTPLGRLSMLNISTVGMLSVPNSSALESSRRELPEDVPFGMAPLAPLSSNRPWKTAPGL